MSLCFLIIKQHIYGLHQALSYLTLKRQGQWVQDRILARDAIFTRRSGLAWGHQGGVIFIGSSSSKVLLGMKVLRPPVMLWSQPATKVHPPAALVQVLGPRLMKQVLTKQHL